jgi:hypothetical protein
MGCAHQDLALDGGNGDTDLHAVRHGLTTIRHTSLVSQRLHGANQQRDLSRRESIMRIRSASALKLACLLPCAAVGTLGCGEQPSALDPDVEGTSKALTVSQRILLPDDLQAGDAFGRSLAAARDQGGHWVVAGAPMKNEGGTDRGAVYGFRKDGQHDWTSTKLIDPNPASLNYFGSALGMGDSFMAVGAYGTNVHGTASGAVHTYCSAGSTMGYLSRIAPDDGAAGDYFGSNLDAAECALYQFLAVGAYGDDDKGSVSGSVYLYRRTRDPSPSYPWSLLKKVVASDGHASQYFGRSISLKSLTGQWTAPAVMAVGAQGDANHGAQTGAVYLYDRYQGGDENWGLVKKIVPDDAHATLLFGCSVVVIAGQPDWEYLAVGAPYDNVNGAFSGSAYIFQRNRGGTNNWGQLIKITPPDGATSDRFGDAIEKTSLGLVISAPGDDDQGTDAGAVYIYDWAAIKNGDTSKYTKISASPAHAGDKLGSSLRFTSAGGFVASAPYNDDRGSDAGAIYLIQ